MRIYRWSQENLGLRVLVYMFNVYMSVMLLFIIFHDDFVDVSCDSEILNKIIHTFESYNFA